MIEEKDMDLIKSLITLIPDFPSKGIMFRDIFPVFRDPMATEFMYIYYMYVACTFYKLLRDLILLLNSFHMKIIIFAIYIFFIMTCSKIKFR